MKVFSLCPNVLLLLHSSYSEYRERQINTDRTAAEEEEEMAEWKLNHCHHPISLNLPSIMATGCVSIINSGKRKWEKGLQKEVQVGKEGKKQEQEDDARKPSHIHLPKTGVTYWNQSKEYKKIAFVFVIFYLKKIL